MAPKNPLFVQEGYSVVYANSLALKAVGLDPAGGAIRPARDRPGLGLEFRAADAEQYRVA